MKNQESIEKKLKELEEAILALTEELRKEKIGNGITWDPNPDKIYPGPFTPFNPCKPEVTLPKGYCGYWNYFID